jgi:hypothetical protein
MDNLKTWREEVMVAGNQLVDRVKELINEGNIRRLVIRKPDGDTLLEIPLNPMSAVKDALGALTPVLAGLGAMAALLPQLRLEILREGEQPPPGEQG